MRIMQFIRPTKKNPDIDNGMVGKYVIVRCHDAGVHAGVLKAHSGRECVLTNSRRLYLWKAAKSATLSGVALYGINQEESRIMPELPLIHLTENCEIIAATPIAEESIRKAPEYDA